MSVFTLPLKDGGPVNTLYIDDADGNPVAMISYRPPVSIYDDPDGWSAALDAAKQEIIQSVNDNERLRARVAALELLRGYAQHDYECPYWHDPADDCGCGLDVALAALQQPQDAPAGAGEVRREGDAAKNAVEAAGAKQDGIAEVE